MPRNYELFTFSSIKGLMGEDWEDEHEPTQMRVYLHKTGFGLECRSGGMNFTTYLTHDALTKLYNAVCSILTQYEDGDSEV